MKYRVGDRVKVHSLKWFQDNCSKNCFDAFEYEDGDNTFVSDMIKFCGQEITINQMHLDFSNYNILEDGGQWHWEDWMFEDMNNNTNTISNPNPNIVEDFAKLIGVELGEEFYDNESRWRYKFTVDSGLMVYDDKKEDWHVASEYPLTAFFKMIKEGKFMKKWTPKDGDEVYFPSFCCEDLREWTTYDSKNEHDKEMLKNGLYFRTQKEATECTKKIIKQMKEGRKHD